MENSSGTFAARDGMRSLPQPPASRRWSRLSTRRRHTDGSSSEPRTRACLPVCARVNQVLGCLLTGLTGLWVDHVAESEGGWTEVDCIIFLFRRVGWGKYICVRQQ